MSGFLTVVEEGLRVPKDKKRKKRHFFDRLAATNSLPTNLAPSSSSRRATAAYDDVGDKAFEEHAKFCRFVSSMNRHRRTAVANFASYPRNLHAPALPWEEDFPVLDIAQFRSAHFLQKFQRLPTSLFWTEFDTQDERRDEGVLAWKYELIEELAHELLGQGTSLRDGLANQRLHHRLSHQLARDRQTIDFLKAEERQVWSRREKEKRRIVKWQDAMFREQARREGRGEGI